MHGWPLSNILTITTQISCLELDQGQVVTTLIVISGITSSSLCNWYHCPHYCDTLIIIGDVMTIKWRHIENSVLLSHQVSITRIFHPFKCFYRHFYPRLNWAEPWCQKRHAEVRRRHQHQEIKHQPRIDWLKPEPGIIKGSYNRGVKLSLNRLKISRKNDKNSGR